mmetsp:Transcript_100503/g.162036  ORF Transcript_100503/g.162036 Transcript_100503/m.162036 type:complete len:459 (+) Transcript_100503:2789-4165(+)
MRVNFCSTVSPSCSMSGAESQSRYATAIVRSPSSAKAPIVVSSACRIGSVSSCGSPSGRTTFVQKPRTISEAPLQKRRSCPSGMATRVLIRLRADENEIVCLCGSSIGNCLRMSRYASLSLLPCFSMSWFASTSIAHSVSLPLLTYSFLSPFSTQLTSVLNDELITTASASICCNGPVRRASVPATLVSACPPDHTLTTVILPVVRVPVLSEQIVVAEPMVSHELMCRTRQLSFCIFPTERERVMATASGSPSGTATTKTVTPTTMNRSHSRWCILWLNSSLQQALLTNARAKRMSKMPTVAHPATAPAFVISSVMSSSLDCSTVFSSSSSAIFCSIRPWYVLAPTASTSMRPCPSCTMVPAKTAGDTLTALSAPSPKTKWPFFLMTDSPVSEASEMPTSFFSKMTPSAHTSSPALSSTMSPTTTSYVEMRCLSPLRITVIMTLSLTALKARNCCSFW